MKSTGEKIRDLRRKHKYSQQKLANALGVAQTAVSGWETGVRGTSIDILMSIAHVFNEPLVSLLPDHDPSDEKTKKALEQIQDELSRVSSVADIPYEKALNLGIISLDSLLEDEIYDRISIIEKNNTKELSNDLKNISDKALFDVIKSVFHLLNKVGKYELYKRALELDELGGKYKED